MLSGITITCFATAYSVTFLMEVARVMFRVAWLKVAALVMAGAGWLTQTVYLYLLALDEQRHGGVIFASWKDWCLLAAWVLAAAYLGLALRRPQTAVGLFMLPVVLALVGLGYVFRDATPFARRDAMSIWAIVHGIALLVGTVAVTIGFVAGVMYLVQSWRLKHNMPSTKGFKLPSLEWLQRMTEESLVISSALVVIGLIAGVVWNIIEHANEQSAVPWTEPTVWSSGLLLLWLVAALLFNWLYKPARQGRKVAYLTLANFGFLALVLSLVLFSQHATPSASRGGGLPTGSISNCCPTMDVAPPGRTGAAA